MIWTIPEQHQGKYHDFKGRDGKDSDERDGWGFSEMSCSGGANERKRCLCLGEMNFKRGRVVKA